MFRSRYGSTTPSKPRSALVEMAEKYAMLSTWEEELLVKDMLAGSMEARQKLIQHNARAVLSMVNKYNLNSDIRDDVEIAALIGLIRAIDKFDPTWNTRVITYARSFIKVEIWDELVNSNTGQNLSKKVYKAVAAFIKKEENKAEGRFVADEVVLDFIKLRWNLNDFLASRVLAITRAGVKNFSDLLVDDENESMEVSDLGSSVFAGYTVDNMEVNVSISEFAERVEKYCEQNCTKSQLTAIQAVVIPFLREKRIVTISEAAQSLGKSYQAVDQIFKFMRNRMANSEEGRFVYRVITGVVDLSRPKV